jgi:hypothetical protein
MKKNILFLLFLVFSSVALSNFKFPNEAQQGTIFLNIERYAKWVKSGFLMIVPIYAKVSSKRYKLLYPI